MKKMACMPPKQKLSALIFGLTLFLLSAANVSLATDITLTWDTNQESNVAFYNVYFKDVETQETWQEPGPAHDPSSKVTSYQILGLDGTRQYCFNVTALNATSIESSPSNEVCTVVAPVDSDSDGDGYTENQGDCNDINSSINPGAEDICGDGIDQDCSNGDAVCPVDPSDVDTDGDGLFDSVDPQPEVYNSPLDDDTAFVRQVYIDFLNREPEADGLKHWVDQLDVGMFDRSGLVEQYLNSAEFGVTVSPVVRLYFTYYQRNPDYDGLMFWVNSYTAGMSLNDISASFATAQEFIDKYGSLTNEEFVSKMYPNVYGRQPDAVGLAYWTDMLDTSTLTRGQVMVEFSTAEEYLQLSANQVYVTMTYMGLLRRAPDQDGFEYWVNSMDLGVSGLGLIDNILASDEYATRFTTLP